MNKTKWYICVVIVFLGAAVAMLLPYNISDLYYINEPTWFEAELDGWGTVTVFYANSLSSHTTPNIMLTDGRGDILYDFKGGTYGYQSGTEVLDIIIRDEFHNGSDEQWRRNKGREQK